MDLSDLKPFHGYQSSIIPFSSGYYVYLASWDSTPTSFPQFSNLWLITPENKRILFSDPPASSDIVCIYHEFDEIAGASINLVWASQTDVHIDCQSIDNEYTLEAAFQVTQTQASRLLLALGSGPPTQLRTSKVVLAVSNFLVNALVARGGSTLLGRTETGQPFYHGMTEKLLQIVSGSITLNGKSIGRVASPTWPVEFGDAVPFQNPVIKLGTLYIPFERDLIHKHNSL
ncbi:MAG: hypothetical protein PVF49_04950 [Anaerolineales bacterium]|jgi:hypothetical protein